MDPLILHESSDNQQCSQHEYAEISLLAQTAESTRGGRATTNVRRAIFLPDSTWDDHIYIHFLNGTKKARTTFSNALQKIQEHVSIEFRFGHPPKGQVAQLRIKFHPGRDNYWESCLGKSDSDHEKNKATMHLSPRFRNKTIDESLIIHELMHFLAFDHEHVSPFANIQWHDENVLNDVKTKLGWSDDEIKANILSSYKASDVVASRFDPDSIMIYDIPNSWTRDGFTARRKNKLSATDKLYLRMAYP